MVNAVRALTLGPQAQVLLGHPASYYVTRSLVWAATILALAVPLAVARYRRAANQDATWKGAEMILATFIWPVATDTAVAIAALGVVAAVWVWQTFAVVVHDDRQTERERRLSQTSASKT
jgi:hypothetical protein